MGFEESDRLIRPDKKQLTYSSYLKVDELVQLQLPVADESAHDEMLFIIIHQTYELWFKQILHELQLAPKLIEAGNLMHLLHTVKRLVTIMKTLTQQVDILETMPPDDFNKFRDALNPASGFQSWQFRLTEFILGSRNTNYLEFYKSQPEHRKKLEDALKHPSIWDQLIIYLRKQGFPIPESEVTRDFSLNRETSPEVTEVLKNIYKNPNKSPELYVILEGLADFDQQFLLWRYRHFAMVQRMIGSLKGTGGSSGAKYLGTTMSKKFFPELWELRDSL